MKIELKAIKIKDLVEGFKDDEEAGVVGFGGKLDIRPPYQREFRYNSMQQEAVINTVMRGFPLNTMYWSVDENGHFEMIDGQQRTLSICHYFDGDFHIVDENGDKRWFHNLLPEQREKFLNYELTVYFCQGSDKEKLEWFRTINIAGAKLLEQELLNAVYSGPWVSDARKYFSKNLCPAYKIAENLLSGSAIQQDYLATVLSWAADKQGVAVDWYMSLHQNDPNANKLWQYFNQVITWVRATFPKWRKEMKGLNWGAMFEQFGENTYDITELEKQIHDLMEDDEIMKKSGIYRYVLSGDLRDLSFRTFDKKQKREAYERQQGICPHCHKHFELEEMEADHITPWKEGGTTVAENCQMLCRNCNRIKGAR